MNILPQSQFMISRRNVSSLQVMGDVLEQCEIKVNSKFHLGDVMSSDITSCH